MNVRCKCCGNVIDKNEAIKVLGIKYNTYYCSKECAYFRDVIDNGIRITAEEKYIMEKLIFKICGLSNIEMFSLILSSNILLCVKSGHCHHYKLTDDEIKYFCFLIDILFNEQNIEYFHCDFNFSDDLYSAVWTYKNKN